MKRTCRCTRAAGCFASVAQTIPWGSSDVVNPTDFLTARDYSFYAVETEKTRTGAISVLVSHAWPHVETTVVATPVPPSTVLLLPPNALPMGITLAEPEAFDHKLENTEVAGKMKFSGRKWDLALVGFRGFNHTPRIGALRIDGCQRDDRAADPSRLGRRRHRSNP